MKTTMLVGAAIIALAATPALAKSDFQGPSIGVQAGWNHDIAINSDKDSVVGGVFAGYDYEIAPDIILGAEGGFSLAASDKIGPVGTNAATIDPDYSFDLSARAGYVVGEKNLVYVRGGYANTRADVTRTVASVTTTNKQTFDGWFVGGGVERKLLSNVSARVEYRFNDFDANSSKYQRHQALVGVAYRF